MMKSKNAPKPWTHRLPNYAPLLIALGLVGVWVCYIMYVSSYLDSRQIFYPMIQLYSIGGTFFGFVFLTVILLHGIALYQRANVILVGLSALGMLAIITFFALVTPLFSSSRVTESVTFNGSVYPLIHVTQDIGWDFDADEYVVLECIESGPWCHRYAKPYTRQYNYEQCQPAPEVHLHVTDSLSILVISVDETVLQVVPWDEKRDIIDCYSLRQSKQ